MKRKTIIIAILAIAVIMTAVFAGCSVKMTTQEIWDAASFKTSDGEAGVDVHIVVSDSGVTLYEYETKNGTVTKNYKIEDLDVPDLDLSQKGVSLNFSSDYLSNEKTSFADDVVTYTADIKNTQAFLDIAGAKDGKLVIKANAESKKLISTEISYVGEKGNNVLITVAPYYA